MITLLTSLKPFKGGAIEIQEKALCNWRALDPSLEIIIYGDGEGIAERAVHYGAEHIIDIRANEKGVPDFSALAEHAATYAKHEIQVYLNGDILLPPDFVTKVKLVEFTQFLMVGQRIDLTQDAVFNHSALSWNDEIVRNYLAGQAQLHGSTGHDYFVFRRGAWQGLARLIVGRGGYDTALVAYCLRRNIPIIDATWSIHVVHQYHDYSHVKGVNKTISEEDVIANTKLHDIKRSAVNIEDSNWRLIDNRVVRCAWAPNPLRRIEVLIRYKYGFKRLTYVCRAITRVAWLFGCLKPRALMLGRVVCADRDHIHRFDS